MQMPPLHVSSTYGPRESEVMYSEKLGGILLKLDGIENTVSGSWVEAEALAHLQL